jgi:hypothetical protein
VYRFLRAGTSEFDCPSSRDAGFTDSGFRILDSGFRGSGIDSGIPIQGFKDPRISDSRIGDSRIRDSGSGIQDQ